MSVNNAALNNHNAYLQQRAPDPRPVAITPREVVKRVAVVASYFFIALLHAVELPLSLITGNIQRMKLNAASIKISFFCLRTYFLPANHPLSARFDFHHMSYGLLTMLLPGRAGNFGKWVTTCSLVNYDHVGGFGHREKRAFQRDADGSYSLHPSHADGSLHPISAITVQDGNRAIQERAFPADNFVVRRGGKLAAEILNLAKSAPYLDAVTAEKDRVIDAVIKPEIAKMAADPARRRMAIDIDFDLFKNSIF